MAYFYFDFQDENKKSRRNLLSSFLVQLSKCSDTFCNILNRSYMECDKGMLHSAHSTQPTRASACT